MTSALGMLATTWGRAVSAAGLPAGLVFHELRHTVAALAIAQGAHPLVIWDRLGHASITVTMDTYGGLFPSLDEAVADGLDGVCVKLSRSHCGLRRAKQRVCAGHRPESSSLPSWS